MNFIHISQPPPSPRITSHNFSSLPHNTTFSPDIFCLLNEQTTNNSTTSKNQSPCVSLSIPTSTVAARKCSTKSVLLVSSLFSNLYVDLPAQESLFVLLSSSLFLSLYLAGCLSFKKAAVSCVVIIMISRLEFSERAPFLEFSLAPFRTQIYPEPPRVYLEYLETLVIMIFWVFSISCIRCSYTRLLLPVSGPDIWSSQYLLFYFHHP